MEDIQAIFRLAGPDVPQDQLRVSRQEVVVGRTASNDLTLNHSQISRQHMRIYWQDGEFMVEDLASTNGVWLNGNRLTAHQPQQLTPGDTLRAGPFTLTYERFEDLRLAQQPPPPPPPQPFMDSPQVGLQELPIMPEVVEAVPVHLRSRLDPRPRLAERANGLLPVVKPRPERYPEGIPEDRSTWLQYLPAIYSDPNLDPTAFIGRYLLIFESILSPITWMIDNFDFFLSSEAAPQEWMQWLASWFDVTLLPEIPIERQREIMRQMGWLFLRRGTRLGLERLMELYFGVKPDIIENADGPCHFLVRLPLSQGDTKLDREAAERLIDSQKPAFTTYTLEIT